MLKLWPHSKKLLLKKYVKFLVPTVHHSLGCKFLSKAVSPEFRKSRVSECLGIMGQ